jgi:hypothetical protein
MVATQRANYVEDLALVAAPLVSVLVHPTRLSTPPRCGWLSSGVEPQAM